MSKEEIIQELEAINASCRLIVQAIIRDNAPEDPKGYDRGVIDTQNAISSQIIQLLTKIKQQ